MYGDFYMNFPTGGIEHHGGDNGRPALKKWAKLNGVDMENVLAELMKIYNALEC